MEHKVISEGPQDSLDGECANEEKAAESKMKAKGRAGSDSPKPGLRERKKAQTVAAIEKATLELAVERGFDKTTIEDICERAGISRMTFFNYFPSKSAALFGRRPMVTDEVEIVRVLEERIDECYIDVVVDMISQQVAPQVDDEIREMRTKTFEKNPELLVDAQRDGMEIHRHMGMAMGEFLQNHPEARLIKGVPVEREVVFAVFACMFLVHVRSSINEWTDFEASAAEIRRFAATHLLEDSQGREI